MVKIFMSFSNIIILYFYITCINESRLLLFMYNVKTAQMVYSINFLIDYMIQVCITNFK
jgi:hypothetical protein